MKLRTRLMLALFLSASVAGAAPVDALRARGAALRLLSSRIASPVVESVEALPAADGLPALWRVSFAGGGFALLRGDDRLPPVAAWSETGDAPWPAEHPAVQDWLELQRLDAAWCREHDWRHPAAVTAWQELEQGRLAERDGPTIEPMLSCTWNQGWPWNQYCPVDAAGPGGHVWSGCVATAMAQLMYFWRWPDYGAGSHSYVHPTYGQQSASFESTIYDWEAMSDDQGLPAEALLQYHCGVAVEMDYAPDGSGAYVGTGRHNSLLAFENYFRYPTRAEFLQHTNLPGAAWAERLAAEIVAGRPVLDSGYGSGGHAFILDGLQDGLFHLNWGWSGWFNGWFEIEALTPGGMEFSIQQGAIVGLERDTAPTALVPDQIVVGGHTFAPILLDLCGSDAQDPSGDLDWWVEENAPLTTTFDAATRTVQVHYPAGWTGGADLTFCVLDPQGLYACDTARFTVTPGALIPAAVADLRLTPLPLATRLDWSAPQTDSSGLWPINLTGFEIHASGSPWFAPGPESRLALLPASARSWTDSQPAAGTRFYRVVALGE